MQLPTLDDVRDAAEGARDAAQRHGRTLIPWLPDPMDCPNCGQLMYAGVTHCPVQVRYVASWDCRACGVQAYREPEVPHEIPQPSPGAPGIKEALS